MTATNGSPSSSSSSATTSSSSDANNPNHNPNPNPTASSSNTIHSWLESVSKAQSRIHALSYLLASPSLIALAESDRPACSLLNSIDAYLAVSAALSLTSAGSGDDPLCHWLYETYQSSDSDLQLVILSFVPLLAGLYLSRVVTFSVSSASGSAPSLAGFEAVLLALYGSEVKARSGKPLLISVPDLSQPPLYHTPPKGSASPHKPIIGVLSPPLEPQIAVKSTKRACIVGVALDCYYKKISLMPPCSKIDFCEFVSSWAGQDCPCRYEFDDDLNFSSSPNMWNFGEDGGDIGNPAEEIGRLVIQDRLNEECNWEGYGSNSRRGSRVPLPWELLQPVLRILGHCLLTPLIPQEVRDAASAAVRCVYARASHDITPQVILASRSLIQLDKSTRKTAKDALILAEPGPASNPSTPSKPRMPEIGPLRCWPGGLCLSRSIGDMDVGEFIVPIPHVKQIKLSTTGGRLIISSDGVWDALSFESVLRCCRGLSVEAAANQIVNDAVQFKGLRDDTTCIVVDILPLEKISPPTAPPKKQGKGVFKNMFCKKSSESSSYHSDEDYAELDTVEELFEDGSAVLAQSYGSAVGE